MKTQFRNPSLILFGFAFISMLALFACSKAEAPKAKEAEKHSEAAHEESAEDGEEIGEASISSESKKLIGLRLVAAQMKQFVSESPVSGSIVASRDRIQQLVPRHGGVLVAMPVTVGSIVKAGDTLAVFRNPETMASYAETASIGGTVIEQSVSIGELANGLVMVIADLSSVWLEIAVPERLAQGLRKGMKGSILQDGPSGNLITPIWIDYVAPMLNPETRTQMVRATLSNASGKWKPGQMLRVVLQGSAGTSALAVPAEAVQTWNGKRIIFAPETDTIFAARAITIGKESNGWIEVIHGLSASDSVVGVGAFELKSKLATANMGDGHNH